MFNPDLSPVLKDHVSRYSLVIATAKRARELPTEDEEGNAIEGKPVSIALDQILRGEYEIKEPDEIANI